MSASEDLETRSLKQGIGDIRKVAVLETGPYANPEAVVHDDIGISKRAAYRKFTIFKSRLFG